MFKDFILILLNNIIKFCFKGSTNDSAIFRSSDLAKMLRENTIDMPNPRILEGSDITAPYFFIGDAGFPLKKYLLTPFSRMTNLTMGQKIFNFRLSRARSSVERGFGILNSRWRILQQPLGFKIENIDTIIGSILCLHNFSITYEINIKEEDRASLNEEIPVHNDDDNEIAENVENEEDALEIRRKLVNYFVSPAGSIPKQWQKV